MNYKEKVAIIIPSLDPDDKLLKLLSDLKFSGFENVIIVNDGSDSEYDKYFQEAKAKYNCIVIKHSVNLGKGRALKSAFNYILVERPEIDCAVTVDSDGQHCIEDIEKCAKITLDNANTLVMGCRDFSNKSGEIPLRSRFGNVMTKKVLKLLCGISLNDTQTGLRGVSRKLMQEFMVVSGERFEYEMNMIIEAKENNISIKEVPIKTIYIEENKTSHFNPLLDSIRIYSVFSKFIISSSSSFLIDIIIFTILVNILKGRLLSYILVSTYSARAMSALFNYAVNKNKVFKNNSSHASTLMRYAILCVLQVTVSAISTEWLYGLVNLNVTLIKVLVDVILFLISFRIQREWVFKKKEKEDLLHEKK